MTSVTGWTAFCNRCVTGCGFQPVTLSQIIEKWVA